MAGGIPQLFLATWHKTQLW